MLDRDPVREDESTLRPAVIASAASAPAYWPRTLTIASASPPAGSLPQAGADAAQGDGDGSRGAPLALGLGGVDGGGRGGERLVVRRSDGDQQLLGRGRLVGASLMFAASSRLSGVAMATRTAVTRSGAPTSRLTCMKRTESA